MNKIVNKKSVVNKGCEWTRVVYKTCEQELMNESCKQGDPYNTPPYYYTPPYDTPPYFTHT